MNSVMGHRLVDRLAIRLRNKLASAKVDAMKAFSHELFHIAYRTLPLTVSLVGRAPTQVSTGPGDYRW